MKSSKAVSKIQDTTNEHISNYTNLRDFLSRFSSIERQPCNKMYLNITLCLFLYVLTIVACVIFIHFMMKNFEEFNQRISNLLFFKMSFFYIFYVLILLIEIIIHPSEEGVKIEGWIQLFVQFRMMAVLYNMLILLELRQPIS